MSVRPPSMPASALTHHDVVMLRWPEQRGEAERLAALTVPCLLLVEPGAQPPTASSCLEDWIRLPADDVDVRARLHALVHRAERHPSVPALDGHGQLTFRGRTAYLSPTDERIARVLVDAFDQAVPEAALLRDMDDDASATKLRVHVSRLRKRVDPIGLEITAIRNFGYRIHAISTASSA